MCLDTTWNLQRHFTHSIGQAHIRDSYTEVSQITKFQEATVPVHPFRQSLQCITNVCVALTCEQRDKPGFPSSHISASIQNALKRKAVRLLTCQAEKSMVAGQGEGQREGHGNSGNITNVIETTRFAGKQLPH